LLGAVLQGASATVLLYLFAMRRLLAILIALCVSSTSMASAHQPVTLLNTDTTAAQFQEGDQISVQYLIVDAKPENSLCMSSLPTLVMTGPKGTKPITMKLNERTEYFEKYGQTTYLYLGRYSGTAVAGVYNFVITSRGKSAITVAVGDKEIPGEVVRGAVPTPTP